MDVSPTLLEALPKVALHDHLDGGLRAATVLELSRELGLPVPGADEAAHSTAEPTGSAEPAGDAEPTSSAEPAGDAEPTGSAEPAGAVDEVRAVADWFQSAADSGSLPAYLSTFEHTVALMQTAPQLRRIAREFVEDMVADGVVYAETRWAPHQHTRGGLSLDEAVQAVQDGLDEGVAAAAESGRRIVVGQLLCYLRHLEPSEDLVDIAIARQDAGVLGIDLAGPEAGFPASWFRAPLERARERGVRVTVHAGEADGPASIADALDCGAERIGHGVRLLEDIDESADGGETGSTGGVEVGTADAGSAVAAPPAGLGRIAARVHEGRICLEVCPSSNLQTGAAADLASHPVGALHRLGFAVALSSDNRLMSRTRTSREMLLTAQTFDWTLADLEQVVLTGLAAGFAPAAQREALRDEVVLPAFRAVREADQHLDQHPDPGAGGNPEEDLSL